MHILLTDTLPPVHPNLPDALPPDTLHPGYPTPQ